MSGFLKIAAVAVIAACCGTLLKKNLKEMALAVALAAGVLILGFAFQALSVVRVFMDTLGETAGLSSDILAPLMKTVGIGLVTRITAELCRDAGEGGIAAFAEIAGTMAALTAALPLLQMVLQMLMELL